MFKSHIQSVRHLSLGYICHSLCVMLYPLDSTQVLRHFNLFYKCMQCDIGHCRIWGGCRPSHINPMLHTGSQKVMLGLGLGLEGCGLGLVGLGLGTHVRLVAGDTHVFEVQ